MLAAVCAAQNSPRNPAFDPVRDVPGLPRVLIIGDSISIGYTLPVRKLLEGRANVHRIPENGGPTTVGLKKIDAWLGDERWDVIHFNWGLHDLKLIDGQRQVALPDYERNLERLVQRLRETGAKLIWAHTTPVPDLPAEKLSPGRRTADVPAYNGAAARVMDAHDVQVNDLYSLALERLDGIQRPANVHFTDSGSAALGEEVAAAILRAIE